MRFQPGEALRRAASRSGTGLRPRETWSRCLSLPLAEEVWGNPWGRGQDNMEGTLSVEFKRCAKGVWMENAQKVEAKSFWLLIQKWCTQSF